MNEFNEDLFDEKKIEQAIKKGKRKSIWLITLISIGVFLGLNIVNLAAYTYYSQRAYEQRDAYVQLSTPNGYISKTTDSKGILGGETQYKVSKDMKIKSLVIEQNQYKFGLLPSLSISRGAGGKIGVTGEDWQFTYKENGWRNLLFFHPIINYEKYKNDTELIEQMEGNKIYEVALSFDQAYTLQELPAMKMLEMTWFWVDTYTSDQMAEMQREANEYMWSANFVREHDALGFSTNQAGFTPTSLEFEYKEFQRLLQASFSGDHHRAYDRIKDLGIDEIDILGMVVYGTKEELMPIINKTFIKAVSVGGIIDNY